MNDNTTTPTDFLALDERKTSTERAVSKRCDAITAYLKEVFFQCADRIDGAPHEIAEALISESQYAIGYVHAKLDKRLRDEAMKPDLRIVE